MHNFFVSSSEENVLNSSDIYQIMRQILLRENKIRRNQEYFWIAGLDNQHKILFIELISLGGTNRLTATPPHVFRMAIYKGAVKVILVHNHPSGALKPSEADIRFSNYMVEAGKFLKMEVIDHLIITEDDYISLADNQMIAKVSSASLQELPDQELQAWKQKVELIRSEKYKALEIAKRMKKEGMDTALIEKLTGLTKSDIQNI